MRTDMKSLNPGKAMAQAAHAANLCQDTMEALGSSYKPGDFERTGYDLWQQWKGCENKSPSDIPCQPGRGFGTTIVLDVYDEFTINTIFEGFERIGGLELEPAFVAYNKVLDSTYPVRDGDVVHTLPVITCAYVFCDRNSIVADNLAELRLHK